MAVGDETSHGEKSGGIQQQHPTKGDLVEQGDHLMRATALLALYGADVAITEFQAENNDADIDDRKSQKHISFGRSATGY